MGRVRGLVLRLRTESHNFRARQLRPLLPPQSSLLSPSLVPLSSIRSSRAPLSRSTLASTLRPFTSLLHTRHFSTVQVRLRPLSKQIPTDNACPLSPRPRFVDLYNPDQGHDKGHLRALCFEEWGDKEGFPVFWLHGLPSSRASGSFLHEEARQHGLRIIAMDRPGHGWSEQVEGRRLKDVAYDVLAVADALSLDRFSIIGWSGGASSALACATGLASTRLLSVHAVASSPPFATAPPEVWAKINWPDRILWLLTKYVTVRPLRMLYRMTDRSARQKARVHVNNTASSSASCPADQETLKTDRVAAALAEDLKEAFRQGPQGVLQDTLVAFQPWFLSWADISEETGVTLWHGQADKMAPCQTSEYLASCIPHATLQILPEQGHYWPMSPKGAATLCQAIRSEAMLQAPSPRRLRQARRTDKKRLGRTRRN